MCFIWILKRLVRCPLCKILGIVLFVTVAIKNVYSLDVIDDDLLSEIDGLGSRQYDSGIDLSGRIYWQAGFLSNLNNSSCSSNKDIYCGTDILVQPSKQSGWFGLTQLMGEIQYQHLTINLDTVEAEDSQYLGDQHAFINRTMLNIGLPKTVEFNLFSVGVGSRNTLLRTASTINHEWMHFNIDGKVHQQGRLLIFNSIK